MFQLLHQCIPALSGDLPVRHGPRSKYPNGFNVSVFRQRVNESADLVLTATTGHRSTVVGLVPAAIGRTFTLREFARLATAVAPHLSDLSDPAARARAAVPAAFRERGAAAGTVSPGDDDVADPIGAPRAFYVARAAEIDAACARAVALFAGGGRLQ